MTQRPTVYEPDTRTHKLEDIHFSIETYNEPTLLSRLLNQMTASGFDIQSIHIDPLNEEEELVMVRIHVKGNGVHITHITKKMLNIPPVTKVETAVA